MTAPSRTPSPARSLPGLLVVAAATAAAFASPRVVPGLNPSTVGRRPRRAPGQPPPAPARAAPRHAPGRRTGCCGSPSSCWACSWACRSLPPSGWAGWPSSPSRSRGRSPEPSCWAGHSASARALTAGRDRLLDLRRLRGGARWRRWPGGRRRHGRRRRAGHPLRQPGDPAAARAARSPGPRPRPVRQLGGRERARRRADRRHREPGARGADGRGRREAHPRRAAGAARRGGRAESPGAGGLRGAARRPAGRRPTVRRGLPRRHRRRQHRAAARPACSRAAHTAQTVLLTAALVGLGTGISVPHAAAHGRAGARPRACSPGCSSPRSRYAGVRLDRLTRRPMRPRPERYPNRLTGR